MNIVFLTADEPLYLPGFFAGLLEVLSKDVRAVFTIRSRYGKDTAMQMVRKYLAAFGLWNLIGLARRLLVAKFFDLLKIGRSKGRHYSVASAAAAHGVHCELVPDVNAESFLQRLRDLKTDLIVSVSCPQLFRKSLIELPPLGCLNVHGAILPKYRGIAPSFWMMVYGEVRAGVTVFLVNEDIDAGDVVVVEEFDILPEESLHQFIVRSKRIARDCLLRAIQMVQDGPVQTTPLNKEEGTYFGFPTREGYREFRKRGRALW